MAELPIMLLGKPAPDDSDLENNTTLAAWADETEVRPTVDDLLEDEMEEHRLRSVEARRLEEEGAREDTTFGRQL